MSRNTEQTPDLLDPLEGILAVLDRGSATGTNKFALLLCLIDLSPSVGADRRITFDQLTLATIDLHWTHTRPFESSGAPLRQVTSGNRNSAALTAVGALKDTFGTSAKQFDFVSPQLLEIDQRSDFRELQKNLRRGPIEKLQNLPGDPPPFLYEVEGDAIRLFEEALDTLVRFGAVLRPLIEHRFVSLVLASNPGLANGDLHSQVREFLFGADRSMPNPDMRKGMATIQNGRCIYTDDRLGASGRKKPIDHVMPWSVSPMSFVENLVVTNTSTNSAKSNLLLALDPLSRWIEHVIQNQDRLHELAAAHDWPSNPSAVFTRARGPYAAAHESHPVWKASGIQTIGADRSPILEAIDRALREVSA